MDALIDTKMAIYEEANSFVYDIWMLALASQSPNHIDLNKLRWVFRHGKGSVIISDFWFIFLFFGASAITIC